MRILITGGSGLLGTCFAAQLAQKYEVVAAGHSRPASHGSKTIMLDIGDPVGIAAALDAKGFTHVIHAAALRSPEECAEDVARAYMVNTVGVENLAEACIRNNCKMIYISTDYVFDGKNPPYKESAAPCPINLYGRTKLAGEFAARAVPKHLVARIPALWGDDPEDAKGNQKSFIEQLRKGEPFPVESSLVRHYSLAGDIAKAIVFCIEKELEGTIHLSARETQTKADFVRALATLHGLDAGLVTNAPLPAGSIPRPQDSTLDSSNYERMNGPKIRGVTEAVADLRSRR